MSLRSELLLFQALFKEFKIDHQLPQVSQACTRHKDYNTYLKSHIEEKLVSQFNCTLMLGQSPKDVANVTTAVCRGDRAMRALEYYKVTPAVTPTLWLDGELK